MYMYFTAVHALYCCTSVPQVGKDANSGDVRLAAKVTEPSTGLKLTVLTNAPGEGGHSSFRVNTKRGGEVLLRLKADEMVDICDQRRPSCCTMSAQLDV
jgi:hypothetical protein